MFYERLLVNTLGVNLQLLGWSFYIIPCKEIIEIKTFSFFLFIYT